MKRILITFVCLIGLHVPYTYAYSSTSFLTIKMYDGDGEKLPLQIKTNPEHNGKPEPRTLIPEVTLQGNTLHFITPCNGCTFRLAHNNNICYEMEITGSTLTIPTTFTGIYEVQIISGDTIFYTEVGL